MLSTAQESLDRLSRASSIPERRMVGDAGAANLVAGMSLKEDW
jgi:hypothetical protein